MKSYGVAQKIYQTHDDDGDICHLASMDTSSSLLLSFFFFFFLQDEGVFQLF